MAACASGSAYVTAREAEEEQVTSSCSPFVTAQIELSKRHWSELAEPSIGISIEEEAAIKLENKESFKTLEKHPQWGHFFFKNFNRDSEVWTSEGSLEVGEKFAEGAQAELFHAHVHWSDPEMNEEDEELGNEWVVKVFKKGTLVRHLQQQWPKGLFQYKTKELENFKLGKPLGHRHHSEVHCATLLEDGRFAFLIDKEDEDLRTLIDRKMMESDHVCGPFSKERGEEIMYRVAQGMNQLHSYGIVHRDLKASNVLVKTSQPSGDYLYCSVADFESSIGVVGTGFWRAPEILQACRERKVNTRPELFSKSADAYSYGMTCYEVLTGRVPFQDHPLSKECSLLTDLVINQHLRPEVPEYVDNRARELLQWCWQFDLVARPSFEEILSFIEANSEVEYIQEEAAERMVVVEEAIQEIPRKFRFGSDLMSAECRWLQILHTRWHSSILEIEMYHRSPGEFLNLKPMGHTWTVRIQGKMKFS